MTDEERFFRELPKKRMGSGALLFDDLGRLLILRTTYRQHWEIPGGIVERDESPRDAALREIREEIGLDLAVSRLRLVGLEYLAPGKVATEALMFVFDGGTLTRKERGAIRIAPEEIAEHGFFPISEAVSRLGSILGPRIERCVRSGDFLYTEASYD